MVFNPKLTPMAQDRESERPLARAKEKRRNEDEQ